MNVDTTCGRPRREDCTKAAWPHEPDGAIVEGMEQAYTGVDNLHAMTEARRYNAYLTSLVESVTRDVTVDFGAGLGTFARELAGRGRRVICIEPDDRLRAGLAQAGLEAHASLSGLADASVDSVYTLNVLEHIEDDRGAIGEIFRVIRPGGACLVYVPALEVLRSAMDGRVGHVRRYSRSELVGKLQDVGFEVRRSAYADSLGYAATLAYKLVGDKEGRLSPGSVRMYDRFVFPMSRALDRLTGRWFGKNVFAVAIRPG